MTFDLRSRWHEEDEAKESIKGNTLFFAYGEQLVAIWSLAISAWRVSVGEIMSKDVLKGSGVEAVRQGAETKETVTADELVILTASFIKFHNRYCQSKPRSPEELRVIRAPLGFEPN